MVGCGRVWSGVVGCGQVWFLNAPSSIIFVHLPGNSASGPQVEALEDFLSLDLKFKKNILLK